MADSAVGASVVPSGAASQTIQTTVIEPSAVEKAHIDQALAASQTAIDAISTVVSVSTWALAIIGIGIAVIAWWGWSTLKAAAREKAAEIVNVRFDDYIRSETFLEMVKERIDKSVQERWQNTKVAERIEEESKLPDDPSPFRSGD